jgi:hypothetical protein
LRRLRAALALVTALGVVAGATGPAAAESRYSLRGFGEATYPARSDIRGLGAAEAASSIPSLSGNPASIGFTDRTLFTGTYVSEWIRTEEPLDGGGLGVRKEYNGLISNLALHFPLVRGTSLGLGLLVSRRRGGLIERDTFTEGGVPYRQSYEADGNVLRLPLLLAWDGGFAQLGAGLDAGLINSKNRWRNTFDPATGFVSSNDLEKTSMLGLGWRLGARVPVSRWGAVGGWMNLPQELRGTRRLENDDGTGDTDDLELSISADPPRSFGVGVEVTPGGGWRVLADWVREDWASAVAGEIPDELRNVDRYAGGVEWTMATPGGATVPVRLGFRHENLQFLDGRGEEVDETVFSGGSGFGFAGGRGQFDWFAEYGWRGEKDRTEYYEQFVRVGFSVTGLEEWSRPAKPEAEEDW